MNKSAHLKRNLRLPSAAPRSPQAMSSTQRAGGKFAPSMRANAQSENARRNKNVQTLPHGSGTSASERILARLKEGLLINLDKHSVERTRQIVDEEIGKSLLGEGLIWPSDQEPADVLHARKRSDEVVYLSPDSVVAAHQQAFNDAIAAQTRRSFHVQTDPPPGNRAHPEYVESLAKTAKGEGFSEPTPTSTSDKSVPTIPATFTANPAPTTEASAPANPAQEASDAKG